MKLFNNINLSFFIFIICIGWLFYFNKLYYKEGFSNKLNFSNTDQWGETELFYKNNFRNSELNKYNSLPKIPFPPNNSYIILDEINDIKSKQKKLTNEKIQNIKKETQTFIIINRFTSDPFLVSKIDYNLEYNISPIIMKLKNEYDRARPYRLDTTINPIIPGPKHPSYPSGHASESYYCAYALSKLYPEKKPVYLKIAKNISENREYAGVHYKSDTEYGMILGEKLAEMYPL